MGQSIESTPGVKYYRTGRRKGHAEARVTILPESLRPAFAGKVQLQCPLGKGLPQSEVIARRDAFRAKCADLFARLLTLPAADRVAVVQAGGPAPFLDAMRATMLQRIAHAAMLDYDTARDASSMPDAARLRHYDALAAARAEVARLEALQAAGQPAAEALLLLPAAGADPMHLTALCTRYLDDTASNRNAEVRGKIESRVRAFIAWTRANRHHEATASDWQALRAAASAYFQARLAEGKAVRSVRMDAGDLVLIGAHALDSGLIDRDPFANIKKGLPEDKGADDSVFSPQEVARLIAYAKAHWTTDQYRAYATMCATGMRAGEVLQLRVQDFRALTAQEVRRNPTAGKVGDMVIDVNQTPDTHPGAKGWKPRHLKEAEFTTRLAPIHRLLLPILEAAATDNALAPRLFMGAAKADDSQAVDTISGLQRAAIKVLRAEAEAKADPKAEGADLFADNGRKLKLHGLRHTVAARAQEAGWDKFKTHSLLGKAPDEYGRRLLQAAELKEALDKLPLLGAP